MTFYDESRLQLQPGSLSTFEAFLQPCALEFNCAFGDSPLGLRHLQLISRLASDALRFWLNPDLFPLTFSHSTVTDAARNQRHCGSLACHLFGSSCRYKYILSVVG